MKKENIQSKSIGIGMIIGCVIGIVTDNIALWLSLGLVFGAGYGQTQAKKGNDEDDKS
ncbi:hypothetical protein [Winogradskyella sp.]|uniref:hypothetical protein n=1 Tax=Winogradskyella sp. TaxID=1883156 RepID=UPI0025DA176E|nr:hypothetical protein [Winogradskyella sp.]